jgi:hypothetical protein
MAGAQLLSLKGGADAQRRDRRLDLFAPRAGHHMQAMIDRLSQDDQPAAVVLGFRPNDPAAYGRVIAGQAVRTGRPNAPPSGRSYRGLRRVLQDRHP